VDAVSTGLFALLSAQLCEISEDLAYCASAYTSAQWLDNHMVRPDGLLWDGLAAGSCKVTDWTFTCRQTYGLC
jgi:predicted alpha-1,6-mannanase (GH76 family)